MASVTSESGVSLLPLIGYAVLATLLAYLGLWMYRHLRSRVQSRFSLPKPVSGSSHKASILGQSTGWNWRRWSLPRVPTWSKVPEAVIGKAKSVATAKNLNVELLPTTALPPPPTSLPTPSSTPLPTQQLIDISTPATPPLTTASTSGSYPMTPRTPSPPFVHHLPSSKPLYQSPMYTSYSRSPSPISNLATYPQKSHRRSKSLGGVPIRRLSGGSSGLRYAMEMQDFSPSHTRGTSREHLLIDFASSGSSDDEDDMEGGPLKISPAASDIGILPAGKGAPPRVDARTVGRHVPLVDLDDKDTERTTGVSRATNDDEEAWKWFSSPKVPVPQSVSFAGLVSQSTSHSETLVDISEKQRPVPVQGDIPIAIRQMELEERREEALVDILSSKAAVEPERKQNVLVNLQENYLDDDDLPLAHLRRSSNVNEQSMEAPKPRSLEPPLVVKAAFSHPLETLVDVGSTSPDTVMALQLDVEERPEMPSLLFQPDSMEDRAVEDSQCEVMDPFADPDERPSDISTDLEGSRLSPPLELLHLKEQPISDVWAWEAGGSEDDPWVNHTSASSSNDTLSTSPTTPESEVFVYTGMDMPVVSEERASEDLITFEASPLDTSDVFVYNPEAEVLEKSPGANLFATELADEEGEMPALDLSEGLSELVAPQIDSEMHVSESEPEPEHNEPEEEEDATPKPTPASVELKLPALAEDIVDEHVIPTMDEDIHLDLVSQVDSGMCTGEYADPDFLPLPDSSLFKVDVPVCEPPSWSKDDKIEDASGRRSSPSQQTPTPPASPPPISPLRVFGASKSTLPSPVGHVSPVDVLPSFRTSPQPSLTLVIGRSPKTSTVALKELEDKENATPVALSSTSATSIVGAKAEIVSVSVEQTSEFPQLERKVLVDIAPEANVDEVDESETRLGTTSKSSAVEQEEEEKITAKEESLEHDDDEEEHISSPLPGTFPDSAPTTSKSIPAATAPSTFGERLAAASDVLTPFPSSRALARSPLDIALAMQLRPGLGAGADPAWMVRFLMAMFGWFAVVVSGQAEF